MHEAWTWLKLTLSGAIGVGIELLNADEKLVVLVVLLIVVDTIAGTAAAWRRGRKITARRLRGLPIKVLEYTTLLLTFSVVATAFDFLGWLQEAAFAYVALTEAKSIVEHVYGPGTGVYDAVMKMRSMLRPGIDPVIEEAEPTEEDDDSSDHIQTGD